MKHQNAIAVSLFFLGFIIIIPFFELPYLTPKLIVLCIAGLTLYSQKKLVLRATPAWALFLFIWPLMSVLWSINKSDSLVTLGLLGTSIIPALFQINSNHKPFQFTLLIAAWVVMLVGFLEKLGINVIPVESTHIMSSIFGNPWLSAQFVLLCLWFIPKNRILAPHMVVMTLYILISGSKTVYLGWVYWALISLSNLGLLRKLFPLFLISLIIALGVWVKSQPADLFKNMVDPDSYIQSYSQQEYIIADREELFKGKPLSMMSRIIMWQNTGIMISKRPIAGFGAGQYRTNYPRFSQAAYPDLNINGWYSPVSAHSFPLTAAAELGIPWVLGLLAMCSLYWRQLKFTHHRHALIYLVLSCLVQPFYLTLPIWFIFLLAPGKDHERLTKERSPGQYVNWSFALMLLATVGVIFSGIHDMRTHLSEIAALSSQVGDDFPFRKAELLHKEGSTDEANQFFQKYLKTDPYSPEGLYNLLQTSNMQPEAINKRKEQIKHAFPFFRPLISTRKTSVFPDGYNCRSDPIPDLRPILLEIQTTREGG